MKFLADNVLLLGLAIGSLVMLLLPLIKDGVKKTSGGATSVSPGDAVLLINRSSALVLDVRNDAEFAVGHITDAKHIPVEQLDDRLGELLKYKDKPIVVNCQAGTRSAKACAILAKHGYSKLYNLEGGLEAWEKARLPVLK